MITSLAKLNADVVLGIIETAASVALMPLLKRISPRGVGSPVITIPGFCAPEMTLNTLNRFLNDIGHDACSWGMGTNTGARSLEHFDSIMEEMGRFIKEKYDAGGPVNLVGHSLGGFYSVQLAKRFPDLVGRVITLGSPLKMSSRVNRAVELAATVIIGRDARAVMEESLSLGESAGIVSIYSKIDGVVPHESSIVSGHDSENIEVTCSHVGMATNFYVLLAVADRLSDKTGLFNSSSYPIVGLAYRRP